MARQKKKNSTLSFSGIGLKPEEDVKLEKLLKEKDLSCRQLIRALMRQWIKEGGNGILKHAK